MPLHKELTLASVLDGNSTEFVLEEEKLSQAVESLHHTKHVDVDHVVLMEIESMENDALLSRLILVNKLNHFIDSL